MIGAIIGDVVGSRLEFHNHLSKEFEFMTAGSEFTDDTVMTCAVVQGLMDSKADFSDLSEKTVEAMQRIGRQFITDFIHLYERLVDLKGGLIYDILTDSTKTHYLFQYDHCHSCHICH